MPFNIHIRVFDDIQTINDRVEKGRNQFNQSNGGLFRCESLLRIGHCVVFPWRFMPCFMADVTFFENYLISI